MWMPFWTRKVSRIAGTSRHRSARSRVDDGRKEALVGTVPASSAVRELDYRCAGGIEVTLLWEEDTNRVFVAVVDERTSEQFELGVEAEDALEAFHHPYGYDRRRARNDVFADLTWLEPTA